MSTKQMKLIRLFLIQERALWIKYTLFLILIGLSQIVHAQEKFTVSGIITDNANGETLIGANVFLKSSDNEISSGTSTNVYGFYSLTAPTGSYSLVVSYLGYETIERSIDLQGNQKLDFEIMEAGNELKEVIVTAEEAPHVNLQSTEMSTSKLNAKVIKQIPPVAGEVDVIKSIQLLPGVTNAGEGASGFNVRGGAEDQNLILLDEAIIYNSSHLFGFFSVFNADAIKDIKLYKGGIPAQFGGRAASVMDIRQKDGNRKDFELSGGISSISSRLTAEGPLFNERGSFLIAGRSSYAHILLQLADEDNNNSAGFYDLNLKTSYRINQNNKLYLSGYFGNDNITFANVFKNEYGNISGNLRWNHIASDNLFTNLSLIYSRYNYQLDINNVGLDWESTIDNYNIRYDVKYYLSDQLKFDFGGSGIYYDFNPGTIEPLDEDSGVNPRQLDNKYAFEGGLYASLEHKISDRLSAQYGIRYSYFSRLGEQAISTYANDLPIVYNSTLGIYQRAEPTGEVLYEQGENIADYGNFEPRLALTYQLDGSSSVKLSYNRVAQYLHLISNTTSATPLDVWTPSGPFLEPQIANQYAAGYFRNFREEAYSLEAEVYYKTVDNRADYIDGADLIAQDNLETEILSGESRAYGVELLLRKNTGVFTGWLAYTISRTEQRTEGGEAGGPGINNGEWYRAAYDRTHDISLTGNYKFNDKWTFGANFIFQTGRPVTYPNGQYSYNGFSIPTFSLRNEDRLPAYHRLDVSATLTPRKNANRNWKGEWVFSVYNLYNRNNAASITFGQDLDTGLNEATKTYIFGLIPSVTYNFKF